MHPVWPNGILIFLWVCMVTSPSAGKKEPKLLECNFNSFLNNSERLLRTEEAGLCFIRTVVCSRSSFLWFFGMYFCWRSQVLSAVFLIAPSFFPPCSTTPSCEPDHSISQCLLSRAWINAQNTLNHPVQTSGQQFHGRAPLKVTMGRQRREQKTGLRGWIWAEVGAFLSLQSA